MRIKIKVFGLFLTFFVGTILILTFLSCNASGKTNIKIEIINYKGWDDAYKLSNETVEVVVVPAIGRIMYYGFMKGENILWNSPVFLGKSLPAGKPMIKNGEIIWANFGGDKVWPIPENEVKDINGYRWPPDHWFDGSAHEVDTIENGIKITSPVSEYCGARCIREIILNQTGPEVTINQTIEKVKQARRPSVEPINFTIWNVSQIRPPLMTLFNLNPNSIHPDRCVMMKSNTINNFFVVGDIGVLIPDEKREQKAGADSDFWLAAIVGDVVFGEFFHLQPDTDYPDNGLSAEVYTEPAYTELEILSPLNSLNIGESMHFSIIWRLNKLSTDNKTDVDKRAAAVGWLNSYVE